MAERLPKPKQLHLDLRMDYLKQLHGACERLDFFETMTQSLLGQYTNLPERGPIWEEINRSS